MWAHPLDTQRHTGGGLPSGIRHYHAGKWIFCVGETLSRLIYACFTGTGDRGRHPPNFKSLGLGLEVHHSPFLALFFVLFLCVMCRASRTVSRLMAFEIEEKKHKHTALSGTTPITACFCVCVWLNLNPPSFGYDLASINHSFDESRSKTHAQ